MNRHALLLSAALSLASTQLHAQARSAAAWRLEPVAGAPVEITANTSHGYAAVPVSALASVGAEVAYAGDTTIARFGAREVRFVAGSQQVTTDGAVWTLPRAVFEQQGALFVPEEFLAWYLADASGGAVQVTASQRIARQVPGDERLAAGQSSPGHDGSPGGGEGDAHPAGASSADGSASPVDGHASPEDRSGSSTIAAQAADTHRMRRLVVVDAGHGGVDPGARGPNGTREKDVTLRVARMVADLLREDPTLEVRMTRDRDTLIALHDRARLANAWRSDGQPAVFISIHCNANPSRSEKGFETYFLSDARTEDARRVETFENASVQYEQHAAAGDALGFILTDLRQNHYLRESSGWAQMIQDELRAVHPGPDRGVKQAGFAVLRGTFMPAVLVEIGFISNVREEQLLGDREMEESIARQLAHAVRAYFDRPGVRPAAD